VVVAMDFQAQLVLDAIAASGEPLVEDARIFDQYTGAPIPDGKKSLAYAISYRAAERTLTDEEVTRCTNGSSERSCNDSPWGGAAVNEDAPAQTKTATMTKADIVERIYEKSGFRKKKRRKSSNRSSRSSRPRLEHGDKVKISGFGNFVVNQKRPRKGRNPQTGEEIIIKRSQSAHLQGQPGLEENHQSQLAPVRAAAAAAAASDGRRHAK